MTRTLTIKIDLDAETAQDLVTETDIDVSRPAEPAPEPKPQPEPDTNVHTVTSPAQLKEATEDLTNGGTILLAPGDYGELSLVDKVYPGDGLRITSDDRTTAVFDALSLTRCRGVHLDTLGLDYVFEPGDYDHEQPFVINQCEDVTIQRSLLDGDAGAGMKKSAIDGYAIGYGLLIKNSKSIFVNQNEIRGFRLGMVCFSNDRLAINKNNIHGMRSDGMNLVSITDSIISNNWIHDFVKAPGSGDHQDAIQGWTTGGLPASRDVNITSNFIDSGDGGYRQAIFFRNEDVDRGLNPENYYERIKINNNLIFDGHRHGITVGETKGLDIINNTLLQNPRDRVDDQLVWVPGILMSEKSQNVSILNNIAPRAVDRLGDTHVLRDNLIISPDTQAEYFPKIGPSVGISELQAGSKVPPGVGCSLYLEDIHPAA